MKDIKTSICTKATASINKEIQQELEIPDPYEEDIAARISQYDTESGEENSL